MTTIAHSPFAADGRPILREFRTANSPDGAAPNPPKEEPEEDFTAYIERIQQTPIAATPSPIAAAAPTTDDPYRDSCLSAKDFAFLLSLFGLEGHFELKLTTQRADKALLLFIDEARRRRQAGQSAREIVAHFNRKVILVHADPHNPESARVENPGRITFSQAIYHHLKSCRISASDSLGTKLASGLKAAWHGLGNLVFGPSVKPQAAKRQIFVHPPRLEPDVIPTPKTGWPTESIFSTEGGRTLPKLSSTVEIIQEQMMTVPNPIPQALAKATQATASFFGGLARSAKKGWGAIRRALRRSHGLEPEQASVATAH